MSAESEGPPSEFETFGFHLRAQVEQQRARAAELLEKYGSGAVAKSTVIADYRCKRRCGLLLVWQVPGPTRLVRLAPYKLSRRRNETTSVAAARARNTSDGDRHWNPQVLVLDEFEEGAGLALALNCDHFSGAVQIDELLNHIRDVRPGKPVERFFPAVGDSAG